jgi:hypothetical protein
MRGLHAPRAARRSLAHVGRHRPTAPPTPRGWRAALDVSDTHECARLTHGTTERQIGARLHLFEASLPSFPSGPLRRPRTSPFRPLMATSLAAGGTSTLEDGRTSSELELQYGNGTGDNGSVRGPSGALRGGLGTELQRPHALARRLWARGERATHSAETELFLARQSGGQRLLGIVDHRQLGGLVEVDLDPFVQVVG